MTGPYQIVEGISGMWRYHLALIDASPTPALCGARTMATSAPLSSWGFAPAHIPTSYCAKCEEIAKKAEEKE